jgi:hypothetical protein
MNHLSSKTNHTTYIVVLLILLGVTARFFPHPANFAPIGAIALFGGLYLNRRMAFILPIGAMLVSDLFIGFYNWKTMVAVYTSFLLMVGIGMLVKKHKRFSTILTGTLLGATLFFLITNAAVWIFGTLYPHTIDGLIASYTMGIPFFKNTLAGDVFFTAVLVGSMESIVLWKKYGTKKTANSTV